VIFDYPVARLASIVYTSFRSGLDRPPDGSNLLGRFDKQDFVELVDVLSTGAGGRTLGAPPLLATLAPVFSFLDCVFCVRSGDGHFAFRRVIDSARLAEFITLVCADEVASLVR
jgi:hypothetical protein